MKKFLNEFKEYISRGNVIDMAVGVVVGGAFSKIVSSLVEDIVMPVIGLITGGIDFSAKVLVLGTGENAATLNYGTFISNIIDFLLISFVIFSVIKAFNKLRTKKEEEQVAPTEKECPYCKSMIPIAATKCAHCTSDVQ